MVVKGSLPQDRLLALVPSGCRCCCDLSRALIPGTPLTFQGCEALGLPGLVGCQQTDKARGPIIKPHEILFLREVSPSAVVSHSSAHTSSLLRIVI